MPARGPVSRRAPHPASARATAARGQPAGRFASPRAAVDRYCEIRNACLLPTRSGEYGDPRRRADPARLLRVLSGLYDQAARTAASL